ncbi:hypothetical protein [Kitasatospora sp. NPDC001527]|uniref:hypothetical protein n=1 Tax=Kitasatospora sp. NPDC001527 TaxID=3154519 RepID=UPI0033239FB9
MTAGKHEPDPDPPARLWEEHLRAPFPRHLRGREIDGEGMALTDASLAGCVRAPVGAGGPVTGAFGTSPPWWRACSGPVARIRKSDRPTS